MSAEPKRRAGPRRRRKRLLWAGAAALAAFAVWFGFFALPEPLFDEPYSAVIEDRHGALLSARIADDGQWRFPPAPRVPHKFAQALIAFEDKRFRRHAGVDPLAAMRALKQNLAAGRVRSGASTITMQVIRMARENRGRTLREKAIEALVALRLELSFGKDEILALYAAHAPFGGNVVGLEAASWRYFGRGPEQLSWAESATLAVLPNAPALIHPGRNRDALQAKRDLLLDTLRRRGVIDALTWQLALAEPLPQKPVPLPDWAPHLLDRVRRERGLARARSTLDRAVQEQAWRVLDAYHRALADNGVHNGAMLVIDNRTCGVLAYVGNVGDPHGGRHESAVDVIPAPRSTGSLLKPFLHAAALQEGLILPGMLLADVPSHFAGYTPKNFDRTYEGAVPADEALSRSLNVPAVRLLRDYGASRFWALLRGMGLTGLNRPASHYGLALILGGAEGSLWDLAGMYGGLARVLDHYDTPGRAPLNAFRPPVYLLDEEAAPPPALAAGLRAGPVWHTMQAMTRVERPPSQGLWRMFQSSRKIAWKTGTSFGFRDAWSIGVTPRYTVAVWIGNADGEGRPGLTGIAAAAPAMFRMFRQLAPEDGWFSRPDGELRPLAVCAKSGHRATELCARRVAIRAPAAGLKARPCPYDRALFIDPAGPWRVHGDCMSPADMTRVPWFVLPPDMAWHYRRNHADYRPPPPYRGDCPPPESTGDRAMTLVYPKPNARILTPVELDGGLGEAVFEVAHREPDKTVYWHLDDAYLGSTRHFHQMALRPAPGRHVLTLVDEDGVFIERAFEVLADIRASGREPTARQALDER